jgi:UDP-N-acetylglucosamine acyltransferase
MAQTHIGHDCLVGNNVTIASYTGLGGHCEIGERVVVGGFVAMHQFVKVGKLAMVAGFTGLRKDAPPFMITYGQPPARVYGLNSIGLKRAGMDLETRELLKSAFRILFRSGLNFSDALAEIRSGLRDTPEIRYLLEFFETSKRGVCSGSADMGNEAADVDFRENVAQTIRLSSGIPHDIC